MMTVFRLAILIGIFGLVTIPSPVLAAEPAPTEALTKSVRALFDTIRTETLPNGLRVYLLPIPKSPIVTTMVAYKVGSADEEKDQTGLSHYLEHLLFKGTEKLMPGDIDRLTQRNGGANNAFTSEDMTVYHFDFAADRWMAGLEIEADRMRNVRIDTKHEFQQEKGAVVAELKRNEDGPWDLEYKTLMPMLYPKSAPYAHPVIGEENHVRSATAEIIKRHYDKWYHPNNASIIIVGGFDPDAALAKIKTLFGSIPQGELPPRKPMPEIPPRNGIVRKELDSKFDVPRMLMGFNGVQVDDPDIYALDVIESVLARGKTSRLYRKLVEGERVAGEVSATNNAGGHSGRYPSWFDINVELVKGKDRAKTEQLVFEELKKLAKEPVTPAELNRIRRSMVASFVFSQESVHSMANLIARSVTLSDLDHLKIYLDKVLAVTPAEIQRVAAKYLDPNKAVIVWSIPADEKEKKEEKKTVQASPTSSLPHRKELARSLRNDASGAGAGFSLASAQRVVLPNGLRLIMLEDHRLPVVIARVSIADVRLREPADKNGVLALLGEMLEEGTTKHTGPEIATLIEDTGGSLSVGGNGGSIKVLTPDMDLGLGLLFDCLIHPSFPAEALEQKRQQLLAIIADSETQPRNKASNLFMKTVYGEHPYSRPAYGSRDVVEKLTAKDLKEFHAKTFGPDAMIMVVVGDFDSKEMTKKIEAFTRDWKPIAAAKPTPPAPPKIEKPIETIVTDPTASQTHVFLGHMGITRNNPDFYKLLVMDNVLGTGPGFTDRLSSTLRDRQGLAYTVNATITSSASDQPGVFLGYIGTFPDKYTWVRDGFLKEINRLRDESPSAQEVEDAKRYLLGSMPFRVATMGQIASELMMAERYGIGFDVLDKFRAGVAAVTPEDVHSMAKKYLDPKKIAIIAVGPIDKDGKPLKTPGANKKDGGP